MPSTRPNVPRRTPSIRRPWWLGHRCSFVVSDMAYYIYRPLTVAKNKAYLTLYFWLSDEHDKKTRAFPISNKAGDKYQIKKQKQESLYL